MRIAPFQSSGCHILVELLDLRLQLQASCQSSDSNSPIFHPALCTAQHPGEFHRTEEQRDDDVSPMCVSADLPRSNLSSWSHKDKLPGIAPDLG